MTQNRTRPKPTTTNRPNHGRATAKIYIDGLSIMTYNDQEIEVVFVEPHHGPIEVMVLNEHCEEVYSYTGTPGKKVQIDIKKISTSHGGGEYYEDGKLNPDDYGFIPDLCKWYNRPAMVFFPDAKEYLSAKLVVKDVVFYTRHRTANDATLISQPSGGTPPPPPGKVSRIVGGDIECHSGEKGVELSITDAGTVKLYKRNAPYYIFVMTVPHASGNHMDLVYDHIIKLETDEPRLFLKYTDEYPLKWDCDDDKFEHDRDKKSTEYACQTHGGGSGDPPDFP